MPRSKRLDAERSRAVHMEGNRGTMTNFARSLHATTSRHVAMGVALAAIATAPAFAEDAATEASVAITAAAQDLPSDANPNTDPAEERAAAGVSDGLLRISVGVEDVDDIIRDVQQALDKI